MEPDLVPSSPNHAEDDEDEVQNEEEEAEGGGGGGGKGRWSGVGSAMLGLGKKAAIAGAALTSAPVVVPPLFLFSALGLAFSVPFGIFFAGVACTDKLMQTLLPPPSPRSQDEEEDVLAEEREKKEVLEEEEKEVGGEKEEKEVQIEKEGMEVVEKEEVKEEQRNVEEGKREEEGRRVIEHEEEKEVEVGDEELTRWEGEGGRVIERVEQAMSACSFLVEIESSRLSSEYASAVEERLAVETTDEAKSESSAEHGSEAKAGAAVDQPSDDFVKGIYNEEEIWEQISALRAVVGYKAALRSSCVEELRALYLFTGIEPPVSLKDPFDPMEVNDKLCFLKSLVGLG
ncbi:uncharacterized protein [Elaeis guineensis]|uniref:uncharacterized protein n=1 Tax=Elaeis guineensis var. tenera TaxID=51953 RepID=UPI003C6CEA1D